MIFGLKFPNSEVRKNLFQLLLMVKIITQILPLPSLIIIITYLIVLIIISKIWIICMKKYVKLVYTVRIINMLLLDLILTMA